MTRNHPTPEGREIGALEREFLLRLAKHKPEQPVGRHWLGSPGREEDRARQRCRKAGWAVYACGGWRITDAGRAALSEGGENV